MNYPNIDPIALSISEFSLLGFSLGPFNVHWYGIMYLCAFIAALLIGRYRAAQSYTPINKAQVEDLIFYGAMGVVIGGRFGYVLFYNFEQFLETPLWLFKIWEGGMAFHGGLLGVIVAMVLYARKLNISFLSLMDFVAPLVPIGLGFGRLGNFIGGELWGRETTVSWAMRFPQDPDALLRHPSQLYQAVLEGLVLFTIVFWFSAKPRPKASVGALFLIFYGLQRFIIEFYREPDAHIGLVMGWVSRGQILSLPMIAAGIIIFIMAYKLDANPRGGHSLKR